MIFSIFRFFCTLRFQIFRYCPIITNHTSMEILFIQLSDYVYISISKNVHLRLVLWSRVTYNTYSDPVQIGEYSLAYIALPVTATLQSSSVFSKSKSSLSSILPASHLFLYLLPVYLGLTLYLLFRTLFIPRLDYCSCYWITLYVKLYDIVHRS